MSSSTGDANSFRDAVAAAQNQIITFKIESTYGPGHQRQVIAVIFIYAWQVLQKGGMNPHGLNSGGYFAWYVEEGKKVGIREQFAKSFETPLTSPHTGQPIMNQCHFHGKFKTCRR